MATTSTMQFPPDVIRGANQDRTLRVNTQSVLYYKEGDVSEPGGALVWTPVGNNNLIVFDLIGQMSLVVKAQNLKAGDICCILATTNNKTGTYEITIEGDVVVGDTMEVPNGTKAAYQQWVAVGNGKILQTIRI